MYNLLFSKLKNIPLIRVFSLIIILSSIVSIISLFCGDLTQTCFYTPKTEGYGIFADSIVPIMDSKNLLSYEYLNEWNRYICYSPICYLFFCFINRISFYLTSVTERDYQVFFVPFYIFFSYLFLYLMMFIKMKKFQEFDRLLFILAILVSHITIHHFESANIIIFSVLFSAFFIFYYDAEKKYLKELALFLLSLAVAIKISPVILVMLLVYRKDFKSVFKVCVYSFSLFVFPSLLFPSGLDSLLIFKENLENLMTFQLSVSCFSGIGKVFLTDLYKGIITFFKPGFSDFNFLYLLASSTSIFLAIIGLFTYFWYSKIWKKLLLLYSLMIVLPVVSNFYNALYYIPVMVFYFKDDQKSKWDYLYFIYFTMCFFSYYFYCKYFNNWQVFHFSIFCIFFHTVLSGIFDFCKNFKLVELKKFIKCKMLLFKIYLKNPKQKNVLSIILRKIVCCFLAFFIILICIVFYYKKNIYYYHYKINEPVREYKFTPVYIPLKDRYNIEIETVFEPDLSNFNVFKIVVDKMGISLQFDRDKKVFILYIDEDAKIIGEIPYVDGTLYNLKFKISNKSKAFLISKYSEKESKWVEILGWPEKFDNKKFDIKNIEIGLYPENAGTVRSFNLIIKKGIDFWVVLITLLSLYLPFFIFFYYNFIRRKLCKILYKK